MKRVAWCGLVVAHAQHGECPGLRFISERPKPPAISYDEAGLAAEQVERVAAMQRGYEERLDRQKRIIDRLQEDLRMVRMGLEKVEGS